jgi:hypothetical protein
MKDCEGSPSFTAFFLDHYSFFHASPVMPQIFPPPSTGRVREIGLFKNLSEWCERECKVYTFHAFLADYASPPYV